MTPFDVHCTTCKAKLIVKRHQAVGKIFRCPHCGGMVLAIQAPPQEAPTNQLQESAEDVPVKPPAARWRGGAAVVGKESRLKARRPKPLLESSYDVVHDLLDQPPVNQNQSSETVDPEQASVNSTPQPKEAGQGERVEAAKTDRPPRRRMRELFLSVITGVLLTAVFFFWQRSHPATAETSHSNLLTLRPAAGAMPSGTPIELQPRFAEPPNGLPRTCSMRQLLDVVSKQLGAPVTLDADSFRFRSELLMSSVQIPKTANTLQEAVNRALHPLHLRISDRGGCAVIHGPVANLRRATHDVSDLARDGKQQEQLVDFVRRFVAPESWQREECELRFDDNVLAVNNTESVHLRILHFCDQLRAARRLPSRSRSTVEPGLSSVWQRAERALNMPVTYESNGPQPLATVLASLEKMAGCFVLVDWAALAAEDFHRAPRVTLNVHEVPLRDALRHLAQQLGLTIRTLDATCCQLTTTAHEIRAHRVAFYRMDASSHFPEVAISLGKQLGIAPTASSQFFGYDEVSETLLAFLPESQHQRLASLISAPSGVE